MQKDLEEFTKVVKEDTAAVYSTVAQKTYESINQYAGEEMAQEAVNIKQAAGTILGSSLRTIVDGVEKILLDDESDEDESGRIGEDKELESKMKNRDLAVENEAAYETNTEMYLNDPLDATYGQWRIAFIESIEARKNKLTDILIARTNVRLMYNRLVPKKVNHNEFWARYMFKLEQTDSVPETKHVETQEMETPAESLEETPEASESEATSDESPVCVTGEKSPVTSDPEIISATEAEATKDLSKDHTADVKDAKKSDDALESDIDDWEKDLDIDDLDLTEEEMAKALAEADKEDWDIDLDDL